jgi:hypothetical protein
MRSNAAVGLALAVFCSALLSGCATFRPEEGRIGEINKSASDYTEQAVLLNVVRSERYEPLSFLVVTGLDGTTSLTGSLGFAGFTLGPHPAASPRDFLIGPNAVSRTGSNTFHVSVIDDPPSFVALLSPLTPATLAFFANEGYPRELLFFLMVDHIRVTRPEPGARAKLYRNDPSDTAAFPDFIGVMATLLRDGLTAEIDVAGVPSGRALPKSALCFDPSLPPPPFVDTGSAAAAGGGFGASCENARWVEAAGAASAPPPLNLGMVAAPDGSLWTPLPGGMVIRHLVPGKPPEDFELPPRKKDPATAPLIAFPLVDPDGTKYEVSFRSVYGVYAYLGALRRGVGGRPTDISNLLKLDSDGKGGILDITGVRGDCFTAVDYEGGHYCVPTRADNTKRLFNVLRQLQEISTAPSNAPTTLTVTNVP